MEPEWEEGRGVGAGAEGEDWSLFSLEPMALGSDSGVDALFR